MGDFLELLAFIGHLYKLAITLVVIAAVGFLVILVISSIASLFQWIF